MIFFLKNIAMRIQFLKLFLVFTLTVTLLMGCAGMSKEDTGTYGGAILGAAICHSFLKGSNKALWTAVCAAGTAFIGNQIGKYLDEQDRQRMAQVTQQAATTGQTRTWTNPENNTRGVARVTATQTKVEPVKVKVLKKKIKKVPPLDMIGQTYLVEKRSNLRGGPGTDYEIVGSLAANKAVNVVGKVKQNDWYLISHDDGVGSGFVYSSLLKPAPNEVPSAPDTQTHENDIAEQQVVADRVCRNIEQSVTLADGATHTENIEVCQGANGWEKKA